MNTQILAHIKKGEEHPAEEMLFSLTGMMEQNHIWSQFDKARTAEFNGLMESGLFTVLPASDAVVYHINGFRFVETVNIEGNSQIF